MSSLVIYILLGLSIAYLVFRFRSASQGGCSKGCGCQKSPDSISDKK